MKNVFLVFMILALASFALADTMCHGDLKFIKNLNEPAPQGGLTFPIKYFDKLGNQFLTSIFVPAGATTGEQLLTNVNGANNPFYAEEYNLPAGWQDQIGRQNFSIINGQTVTVIFVNYLRHEGNAPKCDCGWNEITAPGEYPHPLYPGIKIVVIGTEKKDEEWVGFNITLISDNPNFKMCTVYVKAGNGYYIFAVTNGNSIDVVTPINPSNGKRAGLSHLNVCLCECPPPPSGKLEVKDAVKVFGNEKLAWHVDKSGDSAKGCPGTYTLYSGASVGYKKEESKIFFNVTGPIEVSYTCTGAPGSANVTAIKDTLKAIVGAGYVVVDQQDIAGPPFTLNCGESKTDLNYSFSFAPVAGASGYVNVVVVYYNGTETARFEATFQLPVPKVVNPCVQVWDQWQGQLEKLLGEVCVETAPKTFALDTTLTVEEPSLVNFINNAWLSSGAQTKASFQLEIIRCVEADDFLVAIKVVDEQGNFLGAVECYLYLPGFDPNKPGREASTAYQQLVWGKYPANLVFQTLDDILPGEALVKLKIPVGYEVIGDDYFTFTITPEMAENGVYMPEAHTFVLRKTGDIPPPELPAFNNSKADLIYLPGSGTPTAKREGWDNAVDGEYEGRDATVTARGAGVNPSGPASAVFQFGDGQAHSFEAVGIQTDNGAYDDPYSERQATKIQVWISDDQINWTLLKTIYRNTGGYKYYPLGQVVSTKYIKVELLEPTWVSGWWRQLVEFKVLSGGEKGYPAVESLEMLEAVPSDYILDQNYPNPFNPVTSLRYQLSQDAHVTLTIFDISGQQVARLVDENQAVGWHSVKWDAAGMPSGVYFYELRAGSYRGMKRMLLIK